MATTTDENALLDEQQQHQRNQEPPAPPPHHHHIIRNSNSNGHNKTREYIALDPYNNPADPTKSNSSAAIIESADDDDHHRANETRHACASCKVHARTVLWYLTFVGFAINYMIRINMNITVVAMIASSQSPANKPSTNYHHHHNTSSSSSATTTATTVFVPERWLLDQLGVGYARHGFAWNERQQGLVLGSFFWLHWTLQIPGGLLARRYGTKLVFGVANMLGCVICVLVPLAAYLNFSMLLVLRVLQGVICSVAWPAMHTMTGRWIPPNERSRFVTAYLGSSIGVAVFYPLFGVVIAASSWEWVFHLCGAFGVLWWFAWLYFVYDTPAQHPRICGEERAFIERSLAGTSSVVRRGQRTPWRRILTSAPVLVVCVAQWGGVWGLFTLMTQAPTYFRNVHGWTVSVTGLLSGLPHLMRVAFAIGFSWFGDWLLRSERMTRTNVRKLAGTFSMLVGAVFVVGLAYAGGNAVLAVCMLVAATAVHGAVSTGPLANLVDLSPNYSGVLMGLTGMFSVMPGFISPYVVGQMGNQTSEQWKYIFLITAAMLAVCGLIYVLFGKSDLQSWNTPVDTAETEKEMLKNPSKASVVAANR